MADRDLDPYGNFIFALEIDNHEVAHFRQCSGLKTAAEVFEIEEGGLNGRSHKRTGQSKWENIVLRYGTSENTYLLKWRDKYLQDKFNKRTETSGSIRVMNNKMEVVRRYSFTKAWPVSWEGPKFASSSSEVAVETLEIAHGGLTISND